ncbi:ribonuclease T2-like protein [Chytridium lagenaria]|nr:ribonuclease T2-like protein [Chytridium lagenaria]
MQPFAPLLAILAVMTFVVAHPHELLEPRQATCSANTLSCSSTNSCCVPTNGKMVLAIQWIKGYCATSSCTTAWTIHGLWPNTCTSAIKTSCDSSRAYSNVETLISSSSIYASMKKYWFWAHEWEAHGTCYSPAATTCVGSKPADLTAGIVPGNTYTSTAFKNAIKAAFGSTMTVGLQCTGGNIYEIRLGLLGPSAVSSITSTCGTSFKYVA